MKIKAIIWQEDGVWCGSVPALPGCHTWGESYEQLLEMLEDAVQGWLQVASQQNELAPDKQFCETEWRFVFATQTHNLKPRDRA